jgi:hypothetical protein
MSLVPIIWDHVPCYNIMSTVLLLCRIGNALLSPLTSMGVLTHRSVHAKPSARPPIDKVDIFWRMWLQSHLQTSPPIPKKSYPKFRNPRTNLLRVWSPHIFVT